jgi:hypothetical protein
VQGKALGTSLLACLCLLAGCGGGGDSSASGPVSGPASSAGLAHPPASPIHLPPNVEEKLQEAKQKALQERKAQVKDKSPAAQAPRIAHHDSGGGSAQFKRAKGDDSIVEYGEEASASERDRAAESLHAYLDSLAAHRWAAACRYVSLGLIAQLQQLSQLSKQQSNVEGCPETLATINGKTAQSTLIAAATADVASLRVKGDHAFVIYRGADDHPYAMPMAREGREWRVGSLAGVPAA